MMGAILQRDTESGGIKFRYADGLNPAASFVGATGAFAINAKVAKYERPQPRGLGASWR